MLHCFYYGWIRNLAKIGIKASAKIILKETLENIGSNKVSEKLGEAGISGSTQLAGQIILGITLGIHKKKTSVSDDAKELFKDMNGALIRGKSKRS
ncbi:MAG: hypothetical protein IPL25_10280 [Saprospiraceae bacterium]|nr:hypothetical protein [Candidatus Vicinibacter affinis]